VTDVTKGTAPFRQILAGAFRRFVPDPHANERLIRGTKRGKGTSNRRADAVSGRHSQARIFRQLLPYLRPYRGSVIVVVAMLLAQVALGLLEPWWMQVLVDNGLLGRPLPNWLRQALPPLGAGRSRAIIVFAVLLGIALWVASRLLEIAGDYLKSRVNARLTLAFQANLFNHLQRLSFSYHDRTSVGDSLYRLNNDAGFISTLLWGNFRHLLSSGLTLIGVLWVVVHLDAQLALLALLAAPFLYASVGFYGRHFKARSLRVKSMESASQTIPQEVFSCLRVVKAFGQEEREERRFRDQSWGALLARLRLSLQQSLFSSGLGLVTKLNRSLILLIGGFHVLEGHLTVGMLIVILDYVGRIHQPLQEIGETFTDIQLSLASADRVLDVLDVEPEIRDRPGAKALGAVRGAFAFENVCFAYRPGHTVLHDVSFKARPGEVVAIVGPTGGGKSTLANLIARFYDPEQGRVTLDGQDLRELTVGTLRANIALVLQDPILFSGSVRDNIAYGRPGASMDEVVAAARAAYAHGFITALPDGYASQVGERGGRLSGGERQRIAIARAFLKAAPVLILDEPTSSVDAGTELLIVETLNRLMANRTTFIIAHRLSTIRRADQVLVMDKGRLVQRGTQAELLSREGLFAQLHAIQTAGPRPYQAEVPA
jgi:ATP-binding cassette subfamily B protein